MSVNLFGPPNKNDIRVGYIDPSLGYIENITICQANEYASNNPGTTFIFRDGNNNVRYLNINKVNELTANDLISVANTCGGVQEFKKCGAPKIQIFGGGGIGAAGNPVIGIDGSILAVDVIRGGHGYQYPPLVAAKDECENGNGAKFTAILGEINEISETYEDFEDFESYELCPDISEGYGTNWGPNGEDLGPWQPIIYGSRIGEDPIKDEIERFQKSLVNPFWTTRTGKTSNVTSLGESFSIYEVTDKTHVDLIRKNGNQEYVAWNEFMNKYAISPVPPSNIPGSDYSGRIFTMQWVEDFPTDGEYIFRGLCDNAATVYVDNQKIADLRSFQDAVVPVSKTLTQGIHNIRIDLSNTPINKNVVVSRLIPKFIQNGSSLFLQVDGNGTGTITFEMIVNDNKDQKGVAAKNIVILSDDGELKLKRRNNLPEADFDTKKGKFTAGKIYGPIQISGESLGVIPPIVKDETKIVLFDKQGKDENIVLRISDVVNSADVETKTAIVSNPSATFTLPNIPPPEVRIIEKKDGFYIEVKGKGDITAKAKMEVIKDDPLNYGIAASEIIVPTEKGNVSLLRTSGANSINAKNLTIGQSTFVAGNYLTYETIVKDLNFVAGKTYGPIQFVDTPLKNISGQTKLQKLRGSLGIDLLDGEGTDINIKFDIYGIGTEEIDPKIYGKSIRDTVVVSSSSWNENPMGVSLTIDAPLAPLPKETPPPSDGRCPPNPIWSTRFPSSEKQWYPVRNNAWAKFLNRYAISPVPPEDDFGSDGSGVTYSNSWDVIIPYAGYYGIKGSCDNIGRVLVDGVEKSKLESFATVSPKIEKIFLTKGTHKISVEVSNVAADIFTTINQRIFTTKDWQVKTSTNVPVEFVEVDFDVYGQGAFEDLSIHFTSKDGKDSFTIPGAKKDKKTRTDTIRVKPNTDYKVVAKEDSSKYKNVEQGLIQKGTKDNEGGVGTSNRIFADYTKSENDNDDIRITAKSGTFTSSNKRKTKEGRNTYDLTFRVDSDATQSIPDTLKSGATKGDVVYEGPLVFSYVDKRWGKFMNDNSISPYLPPIDSANSSINDLKTFKWKKVNFPEDGQYKITFQADNVGILYINGVKLLTTTDFKGNPSFQNVNLSAGKFDVVVELENVRDSTDIFVNNPSGFSLLIEKNISVVREPGRSWVENPMGVGVILIPPPCPKLITGKGVVKKIIPDDPGNGYITDIKPTESYPVILELEDIVVENPGINYRCGEDKIVIIPSNGAELDYECDSFGRIVNVTVTKPGGPYNVYPSITMPSETGVNVSFRPVFRVVRDPVQLLIDQQIRQEQLIQVTDLVGLKQTGYYQGRPYYGAVYYENGLKYAGYYKTIGTPVRVYDTLQESITGEITTPASAIQRSGTDVTSNDPRLNIPQTPESTTEI
jgi:hypothetical protein